VNPDTITAPLWGGVLHIKICCAGLVLLKGNVKALTNFEHFKTSLAVIETIFASYVGLVIAPLFREQFGYPTNHESTISG
jgi:hypothetical protein